MLHKLEVLLAHLGRNPIPAEGQMTAKTEHRIDTGSLWISVKDRLPKFDVPILYVVDGATRYVRKGVRGWDGNEYWWCDENGDFDEEGNDGDVSFVTHWMPMPKLPRKRTK